MKASYLAVVIFVSGVNELVGSVFRKRGVGE